MALRVNPDVETDTHHYISTGKLAHKFGIDIAKPKAFTNARASLPNLLLEGVSCHIGSQLMDPEPVMEAVDRVLDLIARLRAKGFDIRHGDFGGGLGVAYKAGEATPSIAEFVAKLTARVAGPQSAGADRARPLHRRQAGVLLTKVLYRKTTGDKEFVIVDAAMNDLIRPALYQAHHEILPVRKRDGGTNSSPTWSDRYAKPAISWRATAICQKFCRETCWRYVRRERTGSRSRPPTTRAARPAEVMVDGDAWSVVRERETYDDLIRGEDLGQVAYFGRAGHNSMAAVASVDGNPSIFSDR